MLSINSKVLRSVLAIGLLIGMLLLGGCGTGSDASEDKEPIRISDTQFQTLWINNAIAEFILKEGYGYPVEIINVSTPVMWESLASGEIDLHMELWRYNNKDLYLEATEAGDIIDLGPVYDTSTQGWYVPRYVIEGCEERGIEPMAPGLESVFDLPDYWEVFQDPEDPNKGVFLNSIHEWDCTVFNDVMIEAWDLDEYYNVQYPGGAAALDSALVGAYERGEPIVGYYWEPTWLMGKYDFVQLDMPEHDSEVWGQMRRVLDGEIEAHEVDEACAYESFAIHKGITSGLKDRAPEVVDFLDEMNVGTDALNETAAFMEVEDADEEEAAVWYLENYQEKWRSWLPDEIEERVEAALIEAGADL